MLTEAQQERERLKAAVTQEAPTIQTEVPVHDQEVTSASPGLATEVGPWLSFKTILSCPFLILSLYGNSHLLGVNELIIKLYAVLNIPVKFQCLWTLLGHPLRCPV